MVQSPKAIEIDSNTRLSTEELNHHLRVEAGPGAGKTHWLVEHIRNVLENSCRLNSTSKLACITYTTIASNEIKERLSISDDVVEVSTIHSFLYKNIVKPYAFLLKDEDGKNLINIEELDGHDEHKPSIGKIKEWIENIADKKDHYLIYKPETIKCLCNLNWQLDSSGQIILDFQNYQKFPKYLLKKAEKYKRLYWQEGIIHHEDVLYFSYEILQNNKILPEFIASRYPYIFLDEFQDTNPIQTKIIELLAAKGSIVGVIGDPAQSIFQFQGAKRENFKNLNLPGLIDYVIKGNRRSSQKIIDLLNYLRNDGSIKQVPKGKKNEGENISLVVSKDKAGIVDFFEERTKNSESKCILARKNESVADLKRGKNIPTDNPWYILRNKDSNRERFLYSLLLAGEYAFQKRYEIAVKEILKALRKEENGELKKPFTGNSILSKLKKRSLAVSLLEYLVNNETTYKGQNLFDFYTDLSSFISKIFLTRLKKITGGEIKKFADSVLVESLAANLNLLEEKHKIRTIHKAKGAEFEDVLLYLDEPKDLGYIIHPSINHKEDEHRIIYVALSRARNRLYISAPSLDKNQKKQIESLGIIVKYLDEEKPIDKPETKNTQ
jgi:DNA helicase-2/ATP-dependent DNA helicase PcrA